MKTFLTILITLAVTLFLGYHAFNDWQDMNKFQSSHYAYFDKEANQLVIFCENGQIVTVDNPSENIK